LFKKPKQTVTDWSAVRASAEAGGFNPAFAAGLSQSNFAAPQFGGVDGLARFGETLIDKEIQETQLDQRQQELDQREKVLDSQAASLRPRPSSAVGASALIDGDRAESDAVSRSGGELGSYKPTLRPTAWSEGYIPVFNPSGGQTMLNKRQAERLKLSSWDMMMVEDFEALGGDEMGQAMAIPHVPSIPSATFGGLNATTSDDFFRGEKKMYERQSDRYEQYLEKLERDKPTGKLSPELANPFYPYQTSPMGSWAQ
jgi:hypothetical protein